MSHQEKQLTLWELTPEPLPDGQKMANIKTIKTEAGQRRYDIAEYLKQKSGTTELARRSTVLYARVSTSSQRDDLKRQTEALTTSYPG
jgi:predicted site-specific integrase-resolvase